MPTSGLRTELRGPADRHKDEKPEDTHAGDKPVQGVLPDTLPGARQVNIYDALEETAA